MNARRFLPLTALGVFLTVAPLQVTVRPAWAEEPADEAGAILDATGVQGGFVVHLGCGDGTLTAALRPNDRYLVHGLDRLAANVERARDTIRSKNLYGPVSVDRVDGARLPYVDNMVNLLVTESPGDIPLSEMVRVLVPHGVAYIKTGDTWKKTVKPRPDNIDEWTHYMHDATGDSVAHDTVVGPPRHLQWIGNPRWSRHHDRMASMSALVSAGGRIFYIMDEGSRVSIQLPPKWALVGRDAFNGTILWRRDVPTWHNHLWPLKSGPTQLARRLVAQGNRVYVTLGFQAPVTAIDAATGETVRTYGETDATEEIIALDGMLYVLVNQGESELASFAPVNNVGDQKRVNDEFRWNEKPRKLMAIDAESGQVAWTIDSTVMPLTLAANGGHVTFHDGNQLVCVDRKTGDPKWQSSLATRRANITMNFGPRLVMYRDLVLFAGGDRTMRAFDAASGSLLWDAAHAGGNYQSPEDLPIVGGLVWTAPTTRTGDTGIFVGRDPYTGKVLKEFAPDVDTYWFHHRCYMAKATDNYLMPSRTGVEFVDPDQEHWDINHWVRGGCLYGIMPANGLTYAPPHDCACYPEAKLHGFNALAPASASRLAPTEVNESLRLERGTAYGTPLSDSIGQEDDWPTLRHDNSRSGATTARLPARLKPHWQTDMGGRLSSVVVANGRLFVAEIDAHTVHALDSESGRPLWSFTAGGRVDSPPTIHRGRALFGSADGWVYCLNAADGQLAWRFRGAPDDRRLMAMEQLESVWPVHGSVLVQDDSAYFVAGRSNFLDGGMRLIRLDVRTGKKLAEQVLDDRDPITTEDIQSHIKILNMPVGLPDVLSSDGTHLYMRSQRFDLEGQRQEIPPADGQPAREAAVQSGDGVHLFSPNGFLDDTWFHRSYWVYGKSFAGGHAGYYQAGKFAPAGRMMVFNQETVFGFGRKPEYLKWTTILEHQLFSTGKQAPQVGPQNTASATGPAMIHVQKSPSLDPTGKPLVVEAWVKNERAGGVVLAHGGPSQGYALTIARRRPQFLARIGGTVHRVVADQQIANEWVYLAGVLTPERLEIYIDGRLAGAQKVGQLIASNPAQALEIGGDDKGSVGDYKAPFAFGGIIDEVRVYHGEVTAAEIARHAKETQNVDVANAELKLRISFDQGTANDASGNDNHGTPSRTEGVAGKMGQAMRFTGPVATGNAGRAGGSFVQHAWNADKPILVEAMALAGDTLYIAGPVDRIDEVESFERLVQRDPSIQQKLAEQDEAFSGVHGGRMIAVSTTDGNDLATYELESIPVWDGMIVAHGRLYLSCRDGIIRSYVAQ